MAAISTNVDVPRKPQKGFGKTLRVLLKQKQLHFMILPCMIWLAIFAYWPMYGITIAFKDYDIMRPVSQAPWVGFAHFQEFLNDPDFYPVLANTLGLGLLKLVLTFAFPIIFALLLNEVKSVKFKKFVQTISYLPHFISWAVLGGMLMTWLNTSGLINDVLVGMHILKEPILFLSEPKYFWGICILSDLWKELGWGAILYLAAIAGIDQEMYEAAIVDGAGRFRQIWNITLPCLAPTIAIMLIFSISGLLSSNFDQMFILRNSLNLSASNVIDIYIYTTGIEQYRYSYSAALGFFKSVIALILLLLANFGSNKLQGTGLF